MKKHLVKLGQAAAQSAGEAGRRLVNVPQKAQEMTQSLAQTVSQEVLEKAGSAGARVLQAKDLAQQSLRDVVQHETTQAVVGQVLEVGGQLVDKAGAGFKMLGDQVVDSVKKVDQTLEQNHLEIKEKTEAVSMGLGIAAGVAAGAAIVGPPVVVAAAPVIGAAATVSGAVAGGAYFYSKWRTKKSQDASTVLLSPSTPPEAKSEATGLLRHDSEQMAKSGNQSEQ